MTLELQYKEELQQALEKERLASNKKQEALRWELQNTRTDIMRLEQQYSLREDILRKEISDLQQVRSRVVVDLKRLHIFILIIFSTFLATERRRK